MRWYQNEPSNAQAVVGFLMLLLGLVWFVFKRAYL